MDPIRLLKKEDLQDSLALSEFAFQFTVLPEERDKRLAEMASQQTLGYFAQEQLAAKLTILELETWINGKAFQMGGIAGVATWPEYRRQGMVGQLLSASLQTMKESGKTVSFLAPFSFAFYRKYGWEAYIEYMRYEIATHQLPKPEVAAGSTLQRIEAEPAVLNPIYEAYAKRFNGMLVRTEEWWHRMLSKRKKGIVTIYRNAAGEPEGYIIYQVKESVFTVLELIALTEDANRGLWRLISNHDSMIDKVVCQTPIGDPLPFVLADPRIKQEVVPYFMARIVDAAAFLREYPFNVVVEGGSEGKPLYLQLRDGHAEWNNGIFRIQPSEGDGNAVIKLSEEQMFVNEQGGDKKEERHVISCDIQTLSALLMGYKRASLLHRIGRLQGDTVEISRWERFIPERTTYLTDFF
ncbi:GNAT family N-acetyltransferase [Paenibacillus qinlingensis]|uniref:GNAT family N-acetyltransferase n=1 Tax=Paenibacillus qinlingensis TaxID=1837343 RepID=UPI001563F2C9|nr:GNAT family N-acetyltransferase [Paenibacillus qinlingensis]NQX59485.1 GNAT family N-acetyltransferase [Paenibacillus qinlingensis]